MAKLEKRVPASFDKFVIYIQEAVLHSSVSTTLEESVDYNYENHKVAIRAFERYSIVGSNRLSLHITMIEEKNSVYITAISTGGSQAKLFKINTLGESSFVESFERVLREYAE